ncbi:MAG: hypothetical protein KDD68_18060, partial [Bdellovibrionales bacterium]|nr:hypothetical protein [Bdellovibrionales bacterium]
MRPSQPGVATTVFLSLVLALSCPVAEGQAQPESLQNQGEETQVIESGEPTPANSPTPAETAETTSDTAEAESTPDSQSQTPAYQLGPAGLPVPPPALSPVNPSDLQGEVNRLRAQQESMQKQLQMLASRLKSLQTGPDMVSSGIKVFDGFGVAASKIYYSDSQVSVGGSAELLSLTDDKDQSAPTLNTWKLSPHIGYRLNAKMIFNSRFTFENTGSEIHAPGSSPKGQVRVDFAYVDLLYSARYNLRIGQQLLPIGLVNQRQDGIFYYSVRPPDVETYLIPSTWSEHGITLWGAEEGLHYQASIYNSLSSKNFTQGTFIRDGRQNGQLAKAEDLAAVVRVDHVSPWGIAGFSGFVGNTAQDSSTIDQGTVGLLEVHMQTFWKAFSVSALAVEGRIQNPDSISLAITGTPDIPA